MYIYIFQFIINMFNIYVYFKVEFLWNSLLLLLCIWIWSDCMFHRSFGFGLCNITYIATGHCILIFYITNSKLVVNVLTQPYYKISSPSSSSQPPPPPPPHCFATVALIADINGLNEGVIPGCQIPLCTLLNCTCGTFYF